MREVIEVVQAVVLQTMDNRLELKVGPLNVPKGFSKSEGGVDDNMNY